MKSQVIVLLCYSFQSCRCTPDTYGPHCASKFDDCERGSPALCGHGLCIDGKREQLNQVGKRSLIAVMCLAGVAGEAKQRTRVLWIMSSLLWSWKWKTPWFEQLGPGIVRVCRITTTAATVAALLKGRYPTIRQPQLWKQRNACNKDCIQRDIVLLCVTRCIPRRQCWWPSSGSGIIRMQSAWASECIFIFEQGYLSD